MIRETTCHPTMIKHVETYLLSKPITKQQKRREGWAELCYPAHQFLFIIQDPFIQNSKKQSPVQLSPYTSYLNIITSHNTQRLFFLSSFLSLSLSFFLFSLFSFFFTGASIQSPLFCSQRRVFLYIWRPNPPAKIVDTQSVLKRQIWVCQEFEFLFNYMLMIIEFMQASCFLKGFLED